MIFTMEGTHLYRQMSERKKEKKLGETQSPWLSQTEKKMYSTEFLKAHVIKLHASQLHTTCLLNYK